MTDNLRDRIAAAVQPFLFDRYDCPIPSETREVADAVIAALGLREEQRSLPDGEGGVSINYKTGERTDHFRMVTDIVSGGMSDNQPLSDIDLRTRITTALQYAAGRQSSWQGLLDCVVMADAVIAELQLTQERDVSQWRNEAGELIVISRYVTDWKADDECP